MLPAICFSLNDQSPTHAEDVRATTPTITRPRLLATLTPVLQACRSITETQLRVSGSQPHEEDMIHVNFSSSFHHLDPFPPSISSTNWLTPFCCGRCMACME